MSTTIRKDLIDLTKPQQVRELNRQLAWVWSQLLGGLDEKSFSSSGFRGVVNRLEGRVASDLNADSVSVRELTAALAKLMVAEIGTAKIDYAQIVDAFANRLFVDSALAGKIRMDALEVTQAQIVDLVVGSLRLVDEDGNIYSVSVGDDGELQTELVEDSSDWVTGDGDIVVPDGYHPIASSMTVGSVTSGKLYVSDYAEIMKLTAKWLSADEAWIDTLVTGLIKSRLGQELNLESNEAIVATVKKGDLEMYLRFDESGINVGKSGDLYHARVTPESFDVMAGDEQVASFRDGLIIMGGWAIRRSADGGLVQSKWEG